MRRTSVMGVVIAAMLLSVATVSADVAMPRDQWSEIRMVSEHVRIDLSPARVTVEATFELKNEQEAVTAVIGYPRGMLETSLDNFEVTVDGEKVAVSSQEGQKGDHPAMRMGPSREKDGSVKSAYQFRAGYPEWKTFKVKFAAGQTRTVVVSYSVTPAELETTDNGKLLAYVYTLKTGADWKGKIDKGVIEMTLNGVSAKDIVTVTPSKHAVKGRMLVWTFEDAKPTQDVEITFKARQMRAGK
ncbi:MAG TPA: hypothetical protein VMY39_06225 [Planctomycetota bacterium]|nr:hypothetical protein [Planctomycetota bacterium]